METIQNHKYIFYLGKMYNESNQDCLERCCLGTYRRIKKVYGVVTHTDVQVDDREYKQNANNREIENFHKRLFSKKHFLATNLTQADQIIKCR